MKWASLFILAMSLPLIAQQPIDGSKNPELIPDSHSQFHILNHHSKPARDVTSPSGQIIHIDSEVLHNQIGLSTSDHAIYDAALQQFAQRMASGGRADEVSASTMILMNVAMSPTGQAKLAAYIQSRKQFILFVPQGALR